MPASLSSLVFSFLAPALVMRYRRRWVYVGRHLPRHGRDPRTLDRDHPGEIAALILRAMSSVTINICLMLYVMDFIPRHQMVRSSRCAFFPAVCPGASPVDRRRALQELRAGGTAIMSFVSYTALLACFAYLRISDNPGRGGGAQAAAQSPGQYQALRRAAALRLAWFVAFGRSAWWAMFFVYPTLYLRNNQVDDTWTGL